MSDDMQIDDAIEEMTREAKKHLSAREILRYAESRELVAAQARGIRINNLHQYNRAAAIEATFIMLMRAERNKARDRSDHVNLECASGADPGRVVAAAAVRLHDKVQRTVREEWRTMHGSKPVVLVMDQDYNKGDPVRAYRINDSGSARVNVRPTWLKNVKQRGLLWVTGPRGTHMMVLDAEPLCQPGTVELFSVIVAKHTKSSTESLSGVIARADNPSALGGKVLGYGPDVGPALKKLADEEKLLAKPKNPAKI